MTALEQAIENNDRAYFKWNFIGRREAYEELNDSNFEVIKSYIAENPDAKGYKYHTGIVDIRDGEKLYNFCFDWIFDGKIESVQKIKSLHEVYTKSQKAADLNRLYESLEEANGFLLIWS